MTNTIKVKRRTSGAAGAPSSLAAGEIAYNEVDNTLYIGFGDDGSGNATSVQAVAGPGAFVSLSSNQSISGAKTFSGSVLLGANATAIAPALSDASAALVTSAWVKSLAYLTGNQTINVTGDVTGSGATTLALTLPNIVSGGTFSKITFNAKGQVTAGALLTAADIPSLTHAAIADFDTQVRTSALDQMAAPTSPLSVANQRITAVASPIAPTDAANRQYVDASVQGLAIKPTAMAATNAALPANTYNNGTNGAGATLTATGNAILQIDSYSTNTNDIVLIKDEATSSHNGLYTVTSPGSLAQPYVLTRHVDMQSANEFAGAFIPVGSAGTNNSNSLWLANSSGTFVVGTTALTFTKLNAATQIIAGNGINVSGTTVSLVVANSSRLSLGGAGLDLVSGVATAGTYTSLTVDTYGRVTAGTNPTTLAGLGITNGQPLNANLTALAGLTGSSNQLPLFTGAGAMTLASFTAFGQSLVAAVGASAVITLLGLGTMATQNASAVAITGGTIDGITIDGGTF